MERGACKECRDRLDGRRPGLYSRELLTYQEGLAFDLVIQIIGCIFHTTRKTLIIVSSNKHIAVVLGDFSILGFAVPLFPGPPPTPALCPAQNHEF